MDCVQKWRIFKLFFLSNIGQENFFYDILGRKIAFLGYKNKKFKKSKNGHFCKGVNPWLWSKNGDFSNFFLFRQYRPGKCLLRNSRTKKRLSTLLKQEIQTVGNDHFSKGGNPWFWAKNGHFSNFYFFRQCNPGKCLLRYSRTKTAFLSYKNKKF